MVIIVASLLILAGVVWIGFTIWQGLQPPKTQSINSQPQNGVSQNSDNSEGQQSPAPAGSEPAVIPVKRSDPELLAGIVSQKPSLVDATGKPSFAIVSSVKTQNAWYVVTITDTNDPSVAKAKIIMKDNGNQGGLVVIAGPGTKFDPEVIALPDEVRKLL